MTFSFSRPFTQKQQEKSINLRFCFRSPDEIFLISFEFQFFAFHVFHLTFFSIHM